MRFALSIDDFQRLSCRFEDREVHTSAESSDVEGGLAALSEALEAVEADGFGECFWFTPAGEYRWVLRRHETDRVRMAVLWCASVAVGYQHVIWHEMPLVELQASLCTELARMAASLGNGREAGLSPSQPA